MKEIKIPPIARWEKEIEPVAYHEWGDDYDTVYRFSPIKGVVCKIWHEEEKYGNDTHGWQAAIETPDDYYDKIAFKELSANDAWRKLYDWASKNIELLLPKTKARIALEKRIATLKEKRQQYIEKNHVMTSRTSEYIGCSCCGSKLKRELLKSDFCPLCKADLRSNTIQETIQRMDAKIAKLEWGDMV